ncbi:M56 family metallopeptidase [Bizionia sediminis]|uniref:M56 family metallopeptidase n=1 Tax=Bizionia sediminis TaxID=1737064 RepID=A0ABW5KTQ3_9FLAO
MIHYIIQVLACQVIFLCLYDVFLKRETFFNWNRVFLLATALLSVVLPFIKVAVFKEVISKEFVLNLPPLLSQTPNTIFLQEVVITGSSTSHSSLGYLLLVLIIGSVLSAAFFCLRLFKIIKLIHQNPKHKQDAVYVVNVLNSSVAFSFFNYIFLGENLKGTHREQIIAHELVHVNQKHTWDLLLFEILRIVFWFNPFVYTYQRRMVDLHEFIADSKAVKDNKKQYCATLLAQIFDTDQVSFVNPFFKQSVIKKRIIMLQKTKSKQVQLVKYGLVIPMVFGMLLYASCSTDTTQPNLITEATEKVSIQEQIDMLKNAIEAEGELTETHKEALQSLLKNTTVRAVEEITETEGADFAEMPVNLVDKAPTFVGCETLSKEDQKPCMAQKLTAFVTNNFNKDLMSNLNITGVAQVRVFFKINADGKVSGIKARAPHPELEAEAKRVISLLPDFIPGQHQNKPVTVPYFLPIKLQN